MKLFTAVRRALRRLAAAEVGVYAANAAFFILLSLFPAMLLLIGLLQYTPLSPDDLQAALSGFLPAALAPLLDYMTQELFVSNSVALLSVSAAVAVWSSSRGVYSLIRGINRVYRLEETRSYFVLRLRSAVDTVLLLLALVVTLILHLFGRQLGQRLDSLGMPFLSSLLQRNHLFIFFVLTVVFCVFYTRFPSKKQRLLAALPGAAGTAVAWIVFSALFTFYISKTGSYSFYYGSLSVIAMTMLWLYGCMCIFFYGGILNAYVAGVLEKKYNFRGSG